MSILMYTIIFLFSSLPLYSPLGNDKFTVRQRRIYHQATVNRRISDLRQKNRESFWLSLLINSIKIMQQDLALHLPLNHHLDFHLQIHLYFHFQKHYRISVQY